MHPLVGNLSELSDIDLEKRYSELLNKINYAYRFGRTGMHSQLSLILSSYAEEINRRRQKVIEEAQKNGKNFNNIIDIG